MRVSQCDGCADSGRPVRTWCLLCNREYNRLYYIDTAPRRRELQAVKKARVLTRNREIVWEYLRSHPCVICGEADLRVLEFDHLDPKVKSHDIADKISCLSVRTLLLEIDKCRVLCANCHRKHTYTQLGWLLPPEYRDVG